LGQQARWEYLCRIWPRYREAGRVEKGRLLDEVCRVTGYHRKYAVRRLNGPPPESRPLRRRLRGPSYSKTVDHALRLVWEAANYPWSVRLKGLLPLWLPWLKKRLSISPRLESQLLRISPRQIDRRLGPYKVQAKRRLYGKTKPGTLLKHQIPIKAERWETSEPGFTEIDLVSHSGDRADGEFIHSLTLTDIHTGWTETCAVLGKSQAFVVEAIEQIRRHLPFELRGIDSDNGSEFVNHHLHAYCQQLGIQFTRGRPYKKDDNAHVEQKNWTHVRRLMGYLRYDSPQALAAINDLYRDELRLLQNLFLPSVKLMSKMRVGSRLRRRYDPPRTALDRLIDSRGPKPSRVAALRALRNRLDPFKLSTTVERKLRAIHALSNPRHNPRPRPMEAGAPVENRNGAVSHKGLGKRSAFPTAPTAPSPRLHL
jgi:integrase-like protein